MELLQPHPLEKTVEKAGGVLENTIRKLVKSGKEATSVAEKEIIKDSSRDSNEFVRIVHPIIIEEKCIHGGKLRRCLGNIMSENGINDLYVPS